MRICVIHLGTVGDCLVATSINKGFYRKYRNPEIDWVVSGEDQTKLLKHSDYVNCVYNSDNICGEYDLLVNLCPSVHPSDPSLHYKDSVGFNFNENSSECYDILFGNRKSNMNIFQVYFKLSNMTWRGEGYSIKYYPKNRQRKNSAAIAVDHLKLRHYIEDRLDLGGLKVSSLKYRKSVFKRMDDLNRYIYIITDDWLTMHLAIYLRKNVHYLETLPLSTKPEFFGKGRVYRVPAKIIK